MTIVKIATAGTTVYYVDKEEKKFLRVKGNTSLGDMWFDGSWNHYVNDPIFEIGRSLSFVLSHPVGAWQRSTPVSNMVEVSEDELPTPNSDPKLPSFIVEAVGSDAAIESFINGK